MSGLMDRRGFVRLMGVSGAAIAASGIVGCGTSGAKVTSGSCKSVDRSTSEKKLVISNWPEYIDPLHPKKGTSTFEKFEKQTGITVRYTQDVNDNAQFYAKVSDQLSGCKSCGRDMFVLTDWMAARMIDLGWIQKLDHSKMPNVTKNLLPSLQGPAWDPHRDYSVPWQSGMTGICYNSKRTDPVTSFKELMTRKDLRGKVDVLSEMRDTMLFMLLLEGADPEKFTSSQFDKASKSLQGFVKSGQIRRFTGNDYLEDLKGGNVIACEAWSGDIPQLGDPKFKWVAAEEGVSLWSDNMLVPNKATHRANAEEWMNFYYDPTIAAQLAAWNYYFCPVVGAEKHIAQFDDTAVGNKLIFPDQKMLARGHRFMSLSVKQSREYERTFTQVMRG
jgi:spermidine/putrescine transport system substrate-binding protein